MSNEARIIVVEDEAPIREGLQDLLELKGYRVETAGEGYEGLRLCLSSTAELIILDIMLPGLPGLEICRTLRQRGIQTPILFLTARTTVDQKVEGFDVGADDYLTKPFDSKELLARVQALLRPYRQQQVFKQEEMTLGPLHVNFTSKELSHGGQTLKMSVKERDLFRFLVDNQGQVVPRQVLLERVWHYAAEVSTRTVDTHILNLRRKLPSKDWIETIHGVGYRLVGPE